MNVLDFSVWNCRDVVKYHIIHIVVYTYVKFALKVFGSGAEVTAQQVGPCTWPT